MGAWMTDQHHYGEIEYAGGVFCWSGGRYIEVSTRWDVLPGVPSSLTTGDVFHIGPYRLRALRQHPVFAGTWVCRRESGRLAEIWWRIRQWGKS
jgi:hypothetical protein